MLISGTGHKVLEGYFIGTIFLQVIKGWIEARPAKNIAKSREYIFARLRVDVSTALSFR